MKYSADLVPHIDTLPTRRRENFPEITDEVFWRFYAAASPYSMVHVTGFYNVFQSLNYIAANKIPGDIIECGCFLGGVGIFMGLVRKHLKLRRKQIYLFDTFEGPPEGPDDIYLGMPQRTGHRLPDYHQMVQDNITDTLSTTDGFVLRRGLVEQTLSAADFKQLCLVRLDTDYYPSTKVEFEILYPKLVRGGVIIIDDYGLYQGARRATDDYLAAQSRRPLLNRIDIGVWAGVKP